MTFSMAARDTSKSPSNERVPGPQTYNSNRDLLLKHNPSATFGNTVREVAEHHERSTEKKVKPIGPQTYTIDRSISPGPGQTMVRSRRKSMSDA